MIKKIVGCIVFALVILCFGKNISGIHKEENMWRIEKKVDAKVLENIITDVLQRGGDDIFLNIHFTPEDMVFVYAELKYDRIGDYLSLPQWLVQTFPEKIALEMQIRPSLDENGKVRLEVFKLHLNEKEMPDVICDAVCSGLTHRINEYIEKQGIRIKKLTIAEGSLRIETEKSSGQ